MVDISQEYLKSVLCYCSESGSFVWLARDTRYKIDKIFNSLYAGKIAGSILTSSRSKTSYIAIKIDGKSYKAHRLAFVYVTGCAPEQVDHIDNNSLNNNLDNLQLITNRENSIKDRTGGESGCVGVFKSGKRWRVRLIVNGIRKHLGTFDSKEEASEYYQNAILALKNGTEIQVKVHVPNHTSKYIGVCLEKKSKKWVAQIRINKIQKTIGRFETEIEASNAYQKQLNEIKKFITKSNKKVIQVWIHIM